MATETAGQKPGRNLLSEGKNFLDLLLSCRSEDSASNLPAADLVLISSDPNKSEKTVDHLMFDKILDPIALVGLQFGLTSLSIGRPPSGKSASATFSPVFTVNRRYLLAFIKDLLLGKFGRAPSFRERLWRDLFRQIEPKAIFMIGAREDYVLAAKALGIPLFEVLHAKNYTSLHFLFRTKRDVPEHILSFDRVSSETFRTLQGDKSQVWNCKDFWLESFLSPSARPELRRLFPEDLAPQNRIDKIALVTLQWGFAGEIERRKDLVEGCIPTSLDQAILFGQQPIHWVIRIHPIQWHSNRKFYRVQRAKIIKRYEHFPNVEVEMASTLPLPTILSSASCHITISSTSAFEACEFGVPTLILESPEVIEKMREKFPLRPLIDSGCAVVAEQSSKFIEDWVMSARRPQNSQLLKFGADFESVLQEAVLKPLGRGGREPPWAL